jgi:HAD superfamily hydrolase (TIGR01509 family)
MIKAFIFDLDGVLVDFKDIHKTAFITAWNKTYHEHLIDDLLHARMLEALSTHQKIDILESHFGIQCDRLLVNDRKQSITAELLETAPVYENTRAALEWAHSQGIMLGCCSNSIRSTVLVSLQKLVPLSYFSVILSNQDITNGKPHPEIYQRAVSMLGVSSDEVLVFEDSLVGKQSARDAGLNVIDVVDAMDITPTFLETCKLSNKRNVTKPVNIVIPMAGMGSRFQKNGYSTPKPFLPVDGKPMFEWVIDNIVPPSVRPNAIIHIIVRSEHLDPFKELNKNNYTLHTVERLTEGAACTVLTVKEAINNDSALVIANSDQYLEWDADNFYRSLFHPSYDGVISTFPQSDSSDLRWSYANLNDQGYVTAVAEKKYIGPVATTGIYGWARGADFVRDAEEMIQANIRVNNEFYVCPVYNQTIARGGKIRIHNCEKMWGLGVPEDYEYFLRNFKRA